MKRTTPKAPVTPSLDMTPVIEEIHSMLTELLTKQRLDIQNEIDKLAREKDEAEKSKIRDKEWKEFVLEEKKRRDTEQNEMLNNRAAKNASELQAKNDAKRWWSFLLDF